MKENKYYGAEIVRRGLLCACLLLLISLIAHAQVSTPVPGHWQYQWLKTDSGFVPPRFTTANRPTPSIGALIYNLDSSRLQYSTASAWITLPTGSAYIPIPNDWTVSFTGDGTLARDTTVTPPGSCGSTTTKYLHYQIPAFIGFRLRLYDYFSPKVEGIAQACANGVNYYAWNSSTGDLFIVGEGDTPGYSIYFRATAY